MKNICIWLIEVYQKYLSFDTGLLRFLAVGGACKYSPSCSEYTKQQIIKKGVFKGLLLGTRRILSCI
ncbi:MAG: hypothetical protein US86_C0002G0030 [Candidatus Daviesbacteria bacterium GW2011_GWA2_38_24]|uniref:Membrane protein insertion efficiency factor YidD n=1 Tax=Candidatus Daviesbacteria bacterium GW2011_GWA2_38_24 TaxID=1618422 RepID=A0A0G0JGT1_9BACT|nr:MAG: hypothetical protein US86_C0002G0030 [Candidatus Daviesbacteria bacterium GW2011_GWA2_38_24]KKQ79774.1 MAG: hypothetical protein UT01_C0028G0007 [Candidatus Daviesbacteria bacterium GW2011_GWA1_38_7]OGE24049.1 MAG: hypothetical protein A2688_01905 [Candidatus Daviesbacteria bacterium RIFCSPHIGHO2_01_FULL_38_8]